MEKRSSIEQALACTLSASNDNEETLKNAHQFDQGDSQPHMHRGQDGVCATLT